MKQTLDIIQYLQKILSLMNIKGEVEVVEDPEINMTIYSITTDNPSLLIGHKGESLAALSHLIKKIYDRNAISGDERASFLIDVNNYQRKRIDELKSKAIILAERARYFKNSVEMEPMSPYDRMIVHSIFSQASDITTRSSGEGKGRRVVLTYIEESSIEDNQNEDLGGIN